MERIIEKYVTDFSSFQRKSVPLPDSDRHVLFTGSTGSVGCQILSFLLEAPSVSLIYCLHRGPDGRARQEEALRSNGLCSTAATNAKVKYIEVDLSKEVLGLDAVTYSYLAARVNIILHNAWELNFNLPIENYEDTHIKGVRSLVEFALAAKFRPRLCFVSSISTVWHWRVAHSGPVPEELIEDPTLPGLNGYGQSKYVAERILQQASSQTGLCVFVLRVTQVGGPTGPHGIWRTSDLVPAMMATSIKFGKVPDIPPNVDMIDWVPVDTTGQVIVEITLSSRPTSEVDGVLVFNIANPSPISWTSLWLMFQEMYTVRKVSREAWVRLLIDSQLDGDDVLRRFPALQFANLIKEFLLAEARPPAEFVVNRTLEVSHTFRLLPPVNRVWILNWLEQWNFSPELMLFD